MSQNIPTTESITWPVPDNAVWEAFREIPNCTTSFGTNPYNFSLRDVPDNLCEPILALHTARTELLQSLLAGDASNITQAMKDLCGAHAKMVIAYVFSELKGDLSGGLDTYFDCLKTTFTKLTYEDMRTATKAIEKETGQSFCFTEKEITRAIFDTPPRRSPAA